MATMEDKNSLGFSAAVVSLGTLASRILGLVRDVSIAYIFGASRVTDVFFIAYQIPSMFRKLLGEGALSSSVVPVFTDLANKDGEDAARRLACAAFTWAIIFVGLLVVVGIIFAPVLVSVIAPGFVSTEYFSLTVSLTRVMFPFLLMMSAAAVVMGVLHARKSYAPSAFAPALLNVALVISVIWLAPRLGADPQQQVWALAVGVLIGGFMQFIIQWWVLSRQGVHLGWLADLKTPGLKRILKMMGPMAFGLAIAQMIVLVDKMVASFLYAGNISHLYYSNRLFQFPFALIAIAVGTVVLPASSEHVSRKDHRQVVLTARHSLKMMSFLMLPSMVGLWMVGHPLIGLLFRSGEFDYLDQNVTFGVLSFALLGLFAYGCIRIFVSLLYSFEDTIGPVIAGALALLINAVFDVLFVWQWPYRNYAVCGLTLAGSMAVWTQVFVLRRRLSIHLPDMWLIPWKDAGKYLLLAIVMGVVIFPVVTSSLPEWQRVAAGSIGGFIVYFLLVHLSGDEYPRRVINRIFRTLLNR